MPEPKLCTTPLVLVVLTSAPPTAIDVLRFSQAEVDGFRESFVSWFEHQVGSALLALWLNGSYCQGRRGSRGAEATEQAGRQLLFDVLPRKLRVN